MKPQSLHCHLPGTPSNLVIFERMRFSLPSKSHTGLVQSRRLVLTAHVSVYAVPGLAVVVTLRTVIALTILHVLRLDVISHIGRLGGEPAL